MSNKMWKEYIVLGDIVNIRNTDGNLEKRSLFPNINEILFLENRLAFLNDKYNELFETILNSNDINENDKRMFNSLVLLSVIALNQGINLAFDNISLLMNLAITVPAYTIPLILKGKLDKSKSNEIVNGAYAVIKLCELEKNKCSKQINKLMAEEIDESVIIRNKLIKIDSDRDYEYQFLAKEGLLEDYGKLEKSLIRKNKRDKLAQYLDLIGCSDDEKLIIHDLINENVSTSYVKQKNLKRH